MVSYEKATKEELIEIIKQYVPYEYHDLHNWEIIIERAKVTEYKDVEFKLSAGILILNTRDLSYKDAFPFGNEE